MLLAKTNVPCDEVFEFSADIGGFNGLSAVDYFFFASSLSSLRASAIAGLGPKSSSSNNWRSSISPSVPSPCGEGARLAQSIASCGFDLTWISQ